MRLQICTSARADAPLAASAASAKVNRVMVRAVMCEFACEFITAELKSHRNGRATWPRSRWNKPTGSSRRSSSTARIDCRPISVVVVEPGCIVKAFQKEDGASMVGFEMASDKACASLALGRISRLVKVRHEERPFFMSFLKTERRQAVPRGRRHADPRQERRGDRRGRRHRRHRDRTRNWRRMASMRSG